MTFTFSVHNVFNIKLTDMPERIGCFLRREFSYFEIKELRKIDLEIKFVEKIKMPDNSTGLLNDFFYKNGIFYFNFRGSKLNIPIKDIENGEVVVFAEKTIEPLMIFYVIEKILHIKMIEKGFCFLHAAGARLEGRTIIYSSLQGGGKTKWVLERIQEGADYLSDELVLADELGSVFAYPRGMNIHSFHYEVYEKVLKKIPFNIRIRREFFLSCLKLARGLLKNNTGIGKKMDVLIKAKSTFRLSVSELYENIKIAAKSRLDKIIIGCVTKQGEDLSENWKVKRTVGFLVNNISNERLSFIAPYLNAFFAYGDDYSTSFRKYLRKLTKKELRILYRVVTKCKAGCL
ncbi:MAG: hypothetical protein ABIH85_08845 [Candidatus Omnitrophota bacterium]